MKVLYQIPFIDSNRISKYVYVALIEKLLLIRITCFPPILILHPSVLYLVIKNMSMGNTTP